MGPPGAGESDAPVGDGSASAKSARMPSPSKSSGGERSGLSQAGASVEDEQGARGGYTEGPPPEANSKAKQKRQQRTSRAHGEVAPEDACVAPPPLVPPRPTPATPPPLLGTTPRHLCLLDRRLLRRLLSGTTPRHLCLLDRRLLHRLLSGTALRRLCLPGRGPLRRLLSLFVVGERASSHGVNAHRGAAKSWRARRASGG